MKQLDQWAHLIADDARAKAHGYTTRAHYLSEIKIVSKAVSKILKPIISESSLELLDAELIPIFNGLALNTNIYRRLSNLQKEYEARAEVRMPPGFKDSKKSKLLPDLDRTAEEAHTNAPEYYGANRFGDFAIWEEILQHCSSQNDIDSVIILTHDQKPDWSYTPQKIIDTDGRIKTNDKGAFRVTVAHPLLAHEGRLRAKISNLYIITTPQLAWIASKYPTGLTMTELSRAVQVETEAESAAPPEEAAAENAAEKPTTPSSSDTINSNDYQTADSPLPADSEAILELLEALPEQATKDRLFTKDPSGSPALNKIIRELKTSNWYSQNPAATEGMQILRGGNLTFFQSFVFGRNIYQSACGSASTPISILDNLSDELEEASTALANIFYAGALYEVYFSKDGEVRPQPKARQITPLFALQIEPRFKPAIDWIGSKLKEIEMYYLVIPSSKPAIKHLNIAFGIDGQITVISAEGVDLSESWDDSAYTDPISPRISYEKLRSQISRHFALPLDQFDLKPVYDGTRATNALQLKSWGPQSGFVFYRPQSL